MKNLSLFTGSGVGEVAASWAGIQTVAMCENNSFCFYHLTKAFPTIPVFKDIRFVTKERLEELGIKTIDIVSGGFPCQDISPAGKRKGIYGERSGLWFEMYRIICECKPRWALIENSSALKTRGADRVISDLEKENYRVWPFVVGAWAVGAPQKRDRAWLVAYSTEQRLEGYRNNTRQKTNSEPWHTDLSFRKFPKEKQSEQYEWEGEKPAS